MPHCPNCNGLLDNANEPCRNCDYETSSTNSTDKEKSNRSRSLPTFASYEDLTNPQARSKKKYWVIAGLVTLLLLAREGGFVNWYLYNFNASSKTQTALNGIEIHDTFKSVVTTKSLVSTFTTNSKQAGFGSQMFGGSRLVVNIQEEIQGKLKNQRQVATHVERIELNGLYWLPFIKSGSCNYRVQVQFFGKDSLFYSGVLDGVTDFKLSGICSMRTLEQTLGDEIAARVIKSVDDLIRK